MRQNIYISSSVFSVLLTFFSILQLQAQAIITTSTTLINCDVDSAVLFVLLDDASDIIEWTSSNVPVAQQVDNPIVVYSGGLYEAAVINTNGDTTISTIQINENTQVLSFDLDEPIVLDCKERIKDFNDFNPFFRSHKWYNTSGNLISTEATPFFEEAGEYLWVNTSDLNGCKDSTIIQIELDDMPPNVYAPDVVQNCMYGRTRFNVTSSDSIVDYKLYDALGEDMLNSFITDVNLFNINEDQNPSPYYLFSTGVNGCIAIDTIELIANSSPLVFPSNEQYIHLCGNESKEVTITADGGVLPYTFFWEGDSIPVGTFTDTIVILITPQMYGTNIVKIVDSSGCSALNFILVGQSIMEWLLLNEEVVGTLPGEATGSIQINPSGGEYTYYWEHNGATTSFVDSLEAGVYYVDITNQYGCTYHQWVVVDELTSTTSALSASVIKIFPNPASSEMTIDFSIASNEKVKLQLFNTVGQLVYSNTRQMGATGQVKFDTQSYESGMYVLQIKHKESIYTKKVFIQQ